MLGHIEALCHNEQQHETHAAEEFEVDPGIGVELIGHYQVQATHGAEKENPPQVQALPHGRGQLNLLAHHGFDEILFHEAVGDQEDDGEQPVENGWFPLDEGFIRQQDGGATKYNNQTETDPLHRVNH